VYFLQNAEGAGLAPFDCWLALRGLKTMALRQERQADNCMKLAQYLAKHPLVKRINYAGGGALLQGRRALLQGRRARPVRQRTARCLC
jgi:cystathionine beta-lyase/cystathionine gamma-synthase